MFGKVLREGENPGFVRNANECAFDGVHLHLHLHVHVHVH